MNNDEGTDAVMTAARFGGLCTTCHSLTAIMGTSPSWNGHIVVPGTAGSWANMFNRPLMMQLQTVGRGGAVAANGNWGDMAAASGGFHTGNDAGYKWGYPPNDPTAAQSNYHQWPCSKCHTPHATILSRLMATNCLGIGRDGPAAAEILRDQGQAALPRLRLHLQGELREKPRDWRRLLVQRLEANALQCHRCGIGHLARRVRIAIENLVKHLRASASHKGPSTREQFVKQNSQGPDIGSTIHVVRQTPNLLRRVLIGTATLGLISIEWHNAVRGWVTPPNLAAACVTPKGFHVWDAQNNLANACVRDGHEWLFLLEDDTIPASDCLLKADGWMLQAKPATGKHKEQGYPIVSGLYYIKNSMVPELGPEPLIYRGTGQRAFWDWTPGDVVRADGVPTGCLLIHRKVLEAYLAEPDMTWYSLPGVPHPLPKIFEAPAQIIKDETGQVAYTASGTSDL